MYTFNWYTSSDKEKQHPSPRPDPPSNKHPHPNLIVGSRIQIPTQHSAEPLKYGVIRWMGEIPAVQGLVAGIEMVSTECVNTGFLYITQVHTIHVHNTVCSVQCVM